MPRVNAFGLAVVAAAAVLLAATPVQAERDPFLDYVAPPEAERTQKKTPITAIPEGSGVFVSPVSPPEEGHYSCYGWVAGANAPLVKILYKAYLLFFSEEEGSEEVEEVFYFEHIEEPHLYNIMDGWLFPGFAMGLLGACPGETRNITIAPMTGTQHIIEKGKSGEHKFSEMIIRSTYEPPEEAWLRITAHVVTTMTQTDAYDMLRDQVRVETIEAAAEECGEGVEYDNAVETYMLGVFVQPEEDGDQPFRVIIEDYPEANGQLKPMLVQHGPHIVPGLVLGLLGACEGEKRRITVPTNLGWLSPAFSDDNRKEINEQIQRNIYAPHQLAYEVKIVKIVDEIDEIGSLYSSLDATSLHEINETSPLLSEIPEEVIKSNELNEELKHSSAAAVEATGTLTNVLYLLIIPFVLFVVIRLKIIQPMVWLRERNAKKNREMKLKKGGKKQK